MIAEARYGVTVRVSRREVAYGLAPVVTPAPMRAQLRNGYTVRASAWGSVILPLPAGNGPFRFLDFEVPNGGFARVSVSSTGEWRISPGTGNNSVSRIDFEVPGGGFAGFAHDGIGFAPVDGVSTGARPHLDLYDPEGSVWRVTVDVTGQFNFAKQ